MENASRALIMAGAVLIAVLVVSLIVYLYATFNQSKSNYVELMNQNMEASFNGKYLVYDGKKDTTYYDILNIATMAYNDWYNNGDKNGPEVTINLNNNDYTKDDLKNQIDKIKADLQDVVKLDDAKYMEIYEKEDFEGRTHDAKQLKKYKCTVTIDSSTNKITVKFTA